jgi:hypothetical protein
MKRWYIWLALSLIVLTLCPPLSSARKQIVEAADDLQLARWSQSTVADFALGTFGQTAVLEEGDGAVQLVEGEREGTYTSTRYELAFPCRATGLLYRAELPAGTELSVELRAEDLNGNWSSWIAVPAGPWTDPAGRVVGESLVVFTESQRLQYRVHFVGHMHTPVLEEVELVYMQAEGPEIEAPPPWWSADGLPTPVLPEEWGGELVPAAETESSDEPLNVEIRPATLTLDREVEAAPVLRMLQRFHREVLSADDVPYTFLADTAGGIYRGRAAFVGDLAYVGILGAHPYEMASPTVEDSLVALLDQWGNLVTAEGRTLVLVAPSDPALASRLWSRWQAGNFRRNRWLLSRGATAQEQHEWILLTNMAQERAQVTADLYGQDGEFVRRRFFLGAESRGSLFANQLIEEGDFWAEIYAENDILVERALYFGHDGDDSVGLDGLSRVWYLPGGTQEAGFSTTLTLLNPWEQPTTATLTLYAPSGVVGEQAFLLAPRARLDVPIAQSYTGSTPIASQVTADLPIAAEQAIRFSAGMGGYGVPGTSLLSHRWTLAGVETVSSCVTLLALLNPLEGSIPITLTLMSEDGTTLRRRYVLPPGEQVLNLNTILPDLALAAEVQAAEPVAAARVTFFNDMQSAHASLGAVRPSRQWFLPEGATAEPFETYLLVANPNGNSVDLEITFLGGRGVLERVALRMPAHARLTVPVDDLVSSESGFSTWVEAGRPVVVERAMYMHERQGGHSSLGIPR